MDESKLTATANQLARQCGVKIQEARRYLRAIVEPLVEAELQARIAAQPAVERPVAPDVSRQSQTYVKIPFVTRQETVASLKRAIAYAAENSPANEELVAYVLTWVFGWFARELSAGNCVRIPGFGLFAPVLSRKAGRPPVVKVYFAPACPLRQEVARCCPPERAKNNTFETFRRSQHPSSRKHRANSTTASAMLLMRKQIVRQALIESFPREFPY